MNEGRRPEMLSYTQELVPALHQLALLLPEAPAVPAPPLPDIALAAELDDMQMFRSETIVRRDLLERVYCCYQGMVTLKRLMHDEWFRVVLMNEAQQVELRSYIPAAIAHLQYIEEELMNYLGSRAR
jgi:hypothetical protein